MLTTRVWTAAATALLLMGSMVRPRQALSNPDADSKTTASHDDLSVALLTDRPLSARVHSGDLPGMHSAQSDLDHVIADVSNPESAVPKYTAKNYVGRIAVNARPSDKHAAP